MSVFFIILLLSLYLQNGNSSSSSGMDMALVYLSNYGYLGANQMTMHSSNKMSVRKGIKNFQSFMGLPATGKLNRATMKKMKMPRCGVKDKTGVVTKRFDKYSEQENTKNRWTMMLLQYKIVKYPRTMKRSIVDATIEKAFNSWSSHTNIMFKPCGKLCKNVDIGIKFVKGRHGDSTPFTGPGGVVAHANFPALGGDIHFDDYETWTINSDYGTNLLQVATHEIGHSLGLVHSDELDAVMCPLTREYTPSFMLHPDDIMAIQNLYGKKNKSMTEPTLPLDPEDAEWTDWWDTFSNLV